MEIKDNVQITLDPEEVKAILKNHFSEKYFVDNIYFVIDAVQAEDDWRSEFPLSHEMTKVKINARKKNESDKPRRVSQTY